jgi:hypothetical protein
LRGVSRLAFLAKGFPDSTGIEGRQVFRRGVVNDVIMAKHPVDHDLRPLRPELYRCQDCCDRGKVAQN